MKSYRTFHLPPESQDAISRLVIASMEIECDPDLSPKNVGSFTPIGSTGSIFCIKMNLTNDVLLEKASPRRAACQMAMYAVNLATGNPLFHNTVKSSMVATYLRNVATLIATLIILSSAPTLGTTVLLTSGCPQEF